MIAKERLFWVFHQLLIEDKIDPAVITGEFCKILKLSGRIAGVEEEIDLAETFFQVFRKYPPVTILSLSGNLHFQGDPLPILQDHDGIGDTGGAHILTLEVSLRGPGRNEVQGFEGNSDIGHLPVMLEGSIIQGRRAAEICLNHDKALRVAISERERNKDAKPPTT